MPPASSLRGGEWLIVASDAASVFTPEQRTDEHRLIARTVSDFMRDEVAPAVRQLEQKDWSVARRLVRRCGELGILGVDVAEAYGGLQLDKVTSVVVAEHVSSVPSFASTFGAHANLAILPVTLFGTEDQKQRYLPRLLSGELVGAYCLSEAGSGSDALSVRTHAATRPDGSFLLNGEKMWTTNGGFADLFIVFAKADGEHFSAFIVERAFGGVTSGNEEHKMGLHGSSTTPVLLQEVAVPAANLLGEIGRGHKIAFNVLNFARYKLGAMCVGGARGAIGESARHARDRRQFGQPIASFGAVAHKLGDMVARTYAAEALVYRTAGLIDARIAETPHEPGDESVALSTLEEYAVEASIAKVACSEMLDYVLDENVQIHGGNGYVRDYPAEGHYRDARVNRIFEGTNEINRLLIPGMLARRAARGDIGLVAAAMALRDELLRPAVLPSSDDGALGDERRSVEAFKKACLAVLGLAMETYRDRLGDQQEVLLHLADMIIDTYSAESAVLRAGAPANLAAQRAQLHQDAVGVFVNDAAMRVEASARQALPAMQQGDELRVTLAAVRRLFRQLPIDTATLRRRLSAAAVACGDYPF